MQLKMFCSVNYRENYDQLKNVDSLKYELTTNFLNLIEYQSDLFTSEEIMCYYNEYSSKILNRVLERKIIRDNFHGYESVSDGEERCSTVLNDNCVFDINVRTSNIPPDNQESTRKVINENTTQPSIVEEVRPESIAYRTRNACRKSQQSEYTHEKRSTISSEVEDQSCSKKKQNKKMVKQESQTLDKQQVKKIGKQQVQIDEQQVQKPVKQQIRKPVKQQIQKPVKQEIQKLVKQQIQKPVTQQTQKTVKQEIEKPVKQQIQKSVKQQIEKPVKQQIQKPVKQQIQKPVKQQIQKPVKQQIQKLVKQQIQKPVKQKIPKLAKQQIQKPVKQKIQKPVKQKIQKPVKWQAHTSVKKQVQKITQQQSTKSTNVTPKQIEKNECKKDDYMDIYGMFKNATVADRQLSLSGQIDELTRFSSPSSICSIRSTTPVNIEPVTETSLLRKLMVSPQKKVFPKNKKQTKTKMRKPLRKFQVDAQKKSKPFKKKLPKRISYLELLPKENQAVVNSCEFEDDEPFEMSEFTCSDMSDNDEF